jgi:hypothetical protein
LNERAWISIPRKIDETVLALLHLTLHDGGRAWKGFDWETMNRLRQKVCVAKYNLGSGQKTMRQEAAPDRKLESFST